MPLDATTPQCVATPEPDPRCGRVAAGWGVIHTHPNAERWACANLNRAGYRTFLPLHTVKRRDPVLRTMTRLVEVPLFVSYAFVSLAPTDPWVPIRYTPGVHSLLMSGPRPNINASHAVSVLEASQELRRSIAPSGASWSPGTALEVAGGSFRGHTGALVRVTKDRAVILLLLFGVLRQVDMPLGNLVAASQDQNRPG